MDFIKQLKDKTKKKKKLDGCFLKILDQTILIQTLKKNKKTKQETQLKELRISDQIQHIMSLHCTITFEQIQRRKNAIHFNV